MVETTRRIYSNKELVEMMLRDQEIHEGNWVLAANLSFTAMNFGQSPDGSDASPAGVVAVTGVLLERVPAPLPFSVNAAEANPKPKPKKVASKG
jgi:hypothetical protein